MSDRVAPTSTDLMHCAKELSPRRNSTTQDSIGGLVEEQLRHFGIAPESGLGAALGRAAHALYAANVEVHGLWEATLREIDALDRGDRIAFFNAKKFLCFQLAKLLDNVQTPLRRSYQSLATSSDGMVVRGAYSLFDNVTALFSATPVIARTATYIYACTEWVDDAFHGREMLLEIYSRLLNPTSIALANHIVDLECGRSAGQYMALNFNSGMAAIDATLSHLLGYEDIVLCSRNVYGGTYQLLHDWYARPENMNIAVSHFDGLGTAEFARALTAVREAHRDRLDRGRSIYIFLESPCNPHGYVLDTPGICRIAHEQGLEVVLDSTVATPFLCRPLARKKPEERPDFVIHSYTKDIAGHGTTTAGCVIARNERMFVPKEQAAVSTDLGGRERTYGWRESMFWNVFYVKGAFLDADKAFEVLSGARTLSLRMARKTINTLTLCRFLAAHPGISVASSALADDQNHALARDILHCGLPAPLFTMHISDPRVDRDSFVRFFDSLEPAFGHQVTLGQANTVVLCPALTSHSEMSADELRKAGIEPSTIRVAVGCDDARELIAHFVAAARQLLEPVAPGFCDDFLDEEAIDALYRTCHHEVHDALLEHQPSSAELAR